MGQADETIILLSPNSSSQITERALIMEADEALLRSRIMMKARLKFCCITYELVKKHPEMWVQVSDVLSVKCS